MGSLFSKSSTEKNSNKQNTMNDSLGRNGEQTILTQNKTLSTMSGVHQRQYSQPSGNIQESIKISTKSEMSRPLQSNGEISAIGPRYSSFKDGNFVKAESSIQNEDPIVEQIQISSNGLLIRSSEKLSQIKECKLCHNAIKDVTIRLNCGHYYHNQCFIDYIESLIQKQRWTIKCVCGTKVSTNVLRQITDIEMKQKLLNKVFSAQVQILFEQSKDLQGYPDFKQIKEIYLQNKSDRDQDFKEVYQKHLEQQDQLRKRVQEISIDQSGALNISQSKLFIIDFCLFCTLTVDYYKVVVPCGHFYHQKCFVQWIENQIINKRSQFIKCRCGSKLNTNLIRQFSNVSDVQKQMRLLNNLFSSQLQKVLLGLRKREEYEQIMDLFYKHQNTEDYNYTSSTGFMYQSEYSTPGGD